MKKIVLENDNNNENESEEDKSLDHIDDGALQHMLDYITDTDALSPRGKEIWENRIESCKVLYLHRLQNIETQKKLKSDIINISDDELIIVFD